ncbi:MAG: cupin domain-containing protein [Verrucomicrobia bacterium]|nr:cupin domain-containing protein [Verrucomicrobiota bacterium]
MNCTRLQELAAAYALGALERPEAVRLEALAASDPDIRGEVDAFLAVARHLVGRVIPVAPPAELRSAILARIRSTPQLGRAPAAEAKLESAPSPEVKAPDLSGFRFVRPDEAEWVTGLAPGLRTQTLATNVRSNYAMVYLELAPGATYPQHSHSGNEELFVVSGDLVSEGQTLKAGDFFHSESGTVHHDLYSPSGCRAILVTPLTSAVVETARLGLRQVGRKVLSTLGLGDKS